MKLKYKIENWLPKSILNIYRDIRFHLGFKNGKRTWSQEGEDVILDRIFTKKNGFYVDVGAHHPFRYSNTYWAYKNGWRGINIDASCNSITLFNRARSNDINLNVGISTRIGGLKYFQFNEPAYNTFDRSLAKKTEEGSKNIHIKKITEVPTTTLAHVLDKHLPHNTEIDFISIDVEGLDLEVLHSNNWEKYKPNIILVEIQWKDIEKIMKDPIYIFLTQHGYKLYSKCINTCIFSRKEIHPEL